MYFYFIRGLKKPQTTHIFISTIINVVPFHDYRFWNTFQVLYFCA